ncbi:hydrogenase expression/formation protein HypE [Coprothermobacter platensis]|uniref:hydrogenase expression/formation protein HypE n=1 Tax=Coprothermobacter platensis TaxID=108819 RepID=UPI000380745D|nr:hydrogenase expression/formation protein HypE [Coprothermobacter platensis]
MDNMDKIPLSVGSGGEEMAEFLKTVVFPNLKEKIDGDAAVIDGIAFTIDSFVADPPFFPGGSIGSLAVSGSINDLVAVGAEPMALALSFIIEEGLDTDVIRRITRDIHHLSEMSGVHVVTGDTKVVQKGAADKVFITSAGIGRKCMDFGEPVVGDKVIVTGDIARHGVAMLLASNQYQLTADIESDCEPLYWLPPAISSFGSHVKWMRDPTRGGVGTILHEFSNAFSLGVRLFDQDIPIKPEVRGVCELLGLEPLHLASEGRMVIIVDNSNADALINELLSHAPGSRIIGEVTSDHKSVTRVVDNYETFVPPLTGEILPRIC